MNPHGTPIWYEYRATDIDSAQAFYAAVVGWRVDPSRMPGMDYRMIMAADNEGVGGMMTLPPGAPHPPGGIVPGWIVYVGVDDVDAAVAAVEAAGGRVHMPATTMPGLGRMALVADPSGAAFYVMRGESDQASTSFNAGADAAPGHVVWNELLAADQDASLSFYAGLLGWRHEGGMPMGPLGDYKFVHAGPVCLGATMITPPGAAAGWRFYTLVPDIDAAASRIAGAGGAVLRGPDPIPGGQFSLMARDPFGAEFGLVGARAA